MSDTVEDRVTALEQWRSTIVLELLRADFQHKFLVDQFNRIDKRFDRYDSNINKFFWTVAGTVIVGFVAFIIKGGLV